MPQISTAGIQTHYEVQGGGPALLMFSPGGFDATLDKWSSLGIYAKTGLLAPLTQHFTCILFDRRECGQSGGRVEPITWQHYAAQGLGLLDHLGITRAHLMGGCMGCSPVLSLATTHPERVDRLVLVWPVGGARYRINGQQRFAQHIAFVQQHGLAAVVTLAHSSTKSFSEDPRAGPWVNLLRRDTAFASAFAAMEPQHYQHTVLATVQALLDRDTAPGAEPEALMQVEKAALVVPGQDASHATSAARYLQECLPRAEYWDLPAAEQTAHNLPQRVLEFLTQP